MKPKRKTRKIDGRVISIRHDKPVKQARVCACGCKEKFTPVRSDQIYYTRACANRAMQRRLRARARIGA